MLSPAWNAVNWPNLQLIRKKRKREKSNVQNHICNIFKSFPFSGDSEGSALHLLIQYINTAGSLTITYIHTVKYLYLTLKCLLTGKKMMVVWTLIVLQMVWLTSQLKYFNDMLLLLLLLLLLRPNNYEVTLIQDWAETQSVTGKVSVSREEKPSSRRCPCKALGARWISKC